MNLPADEFPQSPEAVREALTIPATDFPADLPLGFGSESLKEPFWWDFFALVLLTILSALFFLITIFGVVLIARRLLYPQLVASEVGSIPLVLITAEAVWYVLVLGCMYIVVTRVQHCSDFLAAIRWHWPHRSLMYVLAGVCLAVALEGIAQFLPIPKNLPIDNMFRTPAEAWVLSIFSVTAAPLMEELYFRGFLYPVVARYAQMATAFMLKRWGAIQRDGLGQNIAVPSAILFTALPFALMHGPQLRFSWGPVLDIFLVSLVLTIVRAKTNSVAAGVLIHMGYNGAITLAMFAATSGFRHLEKLNQ